MLLSLGGSGSQNSQNSNSSASKNQKRDRLYCTHCKILGHTVDRCYKIYGYPPGYKFRSNNNSNAAAHQVSTSDDRSYQSNSFGGPSLSGVASTSAANIPVDDIPAIAPSLSGGVVL
ncbi:hypothetical protein F0562_003225 [Nyssa sinensis]|uniref:Uncharacterized protein n=1 Tax=Nyssa sinensis TaxID=561372 RepID=A0A5J5BVT0_9ASTE|nr:hypothetical protein F0562_003225 [Nyssa sinensis]